MATESSNEAVSDIEWKDAPYIVGSGICMGTADVVPGVSGGTMAVALGIYHRLLAAIASVNLRALGYLLKRRWLDVARELHWRFFLCLGSGLVLAVVIMLKVVRLPALLEQEPTYVYAAFFGLVLASAMVLTRRVGKWTLGYAAALVSGGVIGFWVVTLVPVNTPEHPLFIFLCGVISICAMLLPGISGSFILLIMGKYEYVLGALERLLHLDLTALWVVVPFSLGCLTGLASFARVLSWLLRRWHDPVLAFLIGLLLGSLWRIWPYQHLVTQIVRGKPRVMEAHPYLPSQFELSVALLMILGVVAVLAIERFAQRRNSPSG